MVVVSSAILGVLFLFGIIAAILATKRFNPENKQLWEVNNELYFIKWIKKKVNKNNQTSKHCDKQ
jgi:hypothetical protein